MRRFGITLLTLSVFVTFLCLSAAVRPLVPSALAVEEHFHELFGDRSPSDEVLRTSHSRHFVNPDGSKTAYISISPMHYKGTDGKYHLYDLTPNACELPNFAWSVTDNDLNVFFPSNGKGWFKAADLEGHYLLWREKGLYYLSPGGESRLLSSPAGASALPVGTRMRYAGVYPGVTMELVNGPGAMKHSYYFGALPSYLRNVEGGWLAFTTELVLDPRLSLYADGELVTGFARTSGDLVLRLPNGEDVLVLPAPYAGEVGIVRPGGSVDAVYEVAAAEGGYYLTVKVPVSFFTASDRRYPLFVDPSVTLKASQNPTNADEQGYTFNCFSTGSGWNQTQYMPAGTNRAALGAFIGAFSDGQHPYHSMVVFNTSSINDYADIEKVEVRLNESYNWSYNGSGQSADIYSIEENVFDDPYNVDPLDTSASSLPPNSTYPDLYDDMGDGNQYASNMFTTFTNNTWFPGSNSWFDLGEDAIGDCESHLEDAFFGLSIATRQSSVTSQKIATFAAYNDTVTPNRHLLKVTYIDTGTVTVDSNYRPALITVDGVPLDSLPADLTISYGHRTFAAEDEIIIVYGQERYIFHHWSTGDDTPTTTILIDKNFDFDTPIIAYYDHEYYLDVVSSEGNIGGDDSGWYKEGTTIDTYITGSAGQTIDTRRMVTGWTAEGSAPISGSGDHVPPFEIHSYTRIVWSWEVQYKLSMQGALSPYIGPGPGWYFRNQPMVGVGVFPYTQVEPGVRKYAIGWTAVGALGDGTGNVIPNWVMSKPTIITWLYETRYELGITSEHGGITGDTAGYYAPGTEINTGVTRLVYDDTDDGVRYEARSWTATGSLSDGTGTEIPTFVITEPTYITWQWTTQYRLHVFSLFGTVSPEDYSWYDAGSTVEISASVPPDDDRQRFSWVGWNGEGDGSVNGGDPTETVTMNSPITQEAVWDADFYLTLDPGAGGFVNDVSGWYAYGTEVVVQATPPSPRLDTRFVLGWDGEGDGVVKMDPSLGNPSVISVKILSPTLQRAIWVTQYRVRLRNTEAFGDPRPPVGDYWVDEGDTFYGSVMPNVGGMICAGYQGTGSIADGTLPIFSAVITEPSTITWLWREGEELPMKSWAESVLVAQGFRGRNLKAAVTPDGSVFAVAFYSQELRELRCHILRDGVWTPYVIARGESVGTFLDMDLDADGNPHIVYYDGVRRQVRYAYFTPASTKADGGSFTDELVESGDYGRSLSMKLDSTGAPNVVYYDAELGDVRFLKRSGNGWLLYPISSLHDIGFYCALQITPLVDVPQVAFLDRDENAVKYARLENDRWQIETVAVSDNITGPITMSLDIGGRPFIGYKEFAYPDNFLYYIANADENGWHSTPVVEERTSGVNASFVLDKLGYIHFVYNNDETLTYLRYNGRQWERLDLDLGPADAWEVSLAMREDEELVAFFWNGNDMKAVATTGMDFPQDDFVALPPVQAPETEQVETYGGGGGCFVATAAFGSLADASVRSLCALRDASVRSSGNGEALVSLYYAVSPAPAAGLASSEALRALVRRLLD